MKNSHTNVLFLCTSGLQPRLLFRFVQLLKKSLKNISPVLVTVLKAEIFVKLTPHKKLIDVEETIVTLMKTLRTLSSQEFGMIILN